MPPRTLAGDSATASPTSAPRSITAASRATGMAAASRANSRSATNGSGPAALRARSSRPIRRCPSTTSRRNGCRLPAAAPDDHDRLALRAFDRCLAGPRFLGPTMGSTMSTVTTGVIWAALLVGTTGCSVEAIRHQQAGRFAGQQRHHVSRPTTTRSWSARPLPFSLKLDRRAPRPKARNTRGMLLAAASGFTQYAYAYVQQDADVIGERWTRPIDSAARRVRDDSICAARNYGLRGLGRRAARVSARSSVASRNRPCGSRASEDVPLLYWTAASLGSGDRRVEERSQPHRRSADRRGADRSRAGAGPRLRLGAIHGFLITYEPARQGANGDPASRARASISTGWSR